MKKIQNYILFLLLGLHTTVLFGCPVCNTPIGLEVKDKIFNSFFYYYFFGIAFPFIFIGILIVVIHFIMRKYYRE